LLNRENLEQHSDSELEIIYQENQADYEQRIKKNKRIQDLLSKKQDKLEERVRKLQAKIDLLRAKNPTVEVVKRDFDDDEESLNDKIQKHHTTILNLQTSQLKIKKQIKEINLEIAKQQTNEKVLQKEIDHLIMQNSEINKDMENQSEPMRLAVITSEYQSTHDLLDILTLEIETIHKRIHERG
jgi:hypothetical protein